MAIATGTTLGRALAAALGIDDEALRISRIAIVAQASDAARAEVTMLVEVEGVERLAEVMRHYDLVAKE